MLHDGQTIQVFSVLRGEALDIRSTPFGNVGRLFTGDGVEAVWVSKQNEEIDPDWFTQSKVDLILIIQGRLRVEFEQENLEPMILEPGEVMILPPNTRCRAYRWPRENEEASVFFAVYPIGVESNGQRQTNGV